MWLLFLISCGEEEKSSPIPDDPPFVYEDVEVGQELSAELLLRRLSFDLRGIPPSIEEIESLETIGVDAFIEDFLQDPLHEEQLRTLLSEWFLTRIDKFNVDHRDYRLPDEDAFAFVQSVGEEPLRLMAHVGSKDAPWTEILTADYTMANDLLLSIWPLEALEEEGDWRKASYTDGRPAGGVLMSNGLWWRYYTTPNNFSRTRAMALANLFICENYLERPIKFEAPSLLERDSLNEVIRTNPACIGCHSTLDPIAASLFGFWWFDLYDTAEMTSYHPEREQLGRYFLETEPAWFGVPLQSPAELPLFMAADERFTTCTVERMTELLWRREVGAEDFSHLLKLKYDFQDADLRMSGLIRAIVSSPPYRVGAPFSGSDDVDLMTRRMLSVSQLIQTVELRTGFRWKVDNVDVFENDTVGYRILAGGFDGIEATQSSRMPSISRQLAIKRLSQLAAAYAVDNEEEQSPEDRRLFLNVDFLSLDVDDPEFEDTLIRLYRLFHTQIPSSQRLELDKDMWGRIRNESNAKQAWKSFISVLIRDPSFWSY